MKNKIKLYSIILFVISSIVLLIGYCFHDFNALAIDTIKLPQTEKFDMTTYKIGKHKVWEMKNVSKYNGDYCFRKSFDDGKKIINQFYMINKKVQDIETFEKEFIRHLEIKPDIGDTFVVKYYFYLESKDLPKYWKPVWNKRCIDELTQHEDDLLFTITID